MKNQIKIALAEDHLLFRQGMISLLDEYKDIKVLFHVSNGKELMDELKKTQPDLVLLDIEMPVMSGKEALEKIRYKYPLVKVVMLTQYYSDAYIGEFMRRGASTYLAKNSSIDKIVEVIRAVYSDGLFIDKKILNAIQQPGIPSSIEEPEVEYESLFTERELDVLRLIRQGKPAKEIADILFISKKTVENHKSSLFRKTGSSNSLELLNYASKHNIQ